MEKEKAGADVDGAAADVCCGGVGAADGPTDPWCEEAGVNEKGDPEGDLSFDGWSTGVEAANAN